MITREDHLGAMEEIRDVTQRMATPELQLRFLEMFWAKRCLELAECAHLSAERLRFRIRDQELLRFYAYKSAGGEGPEAIAAAFSKTMQNYVQTSQWLVHCVHEGHDWVNAEIARMRAKEAAQAPGGAAITARPVEVVRKKKGKHGSSAGRSSTPQKDRPKR